MYISSHAWANLMRRVTNLEEAMTDINADQTHLDAEVADLEAARVNIEAEIAALKAQPAGTPLDFTGLDAAVSSSVRTVRRLLLRLLPDIRCEGLR